MPEWLDAEVFQSVLSGLQTGVYLVDRERKIVFWNDGAQRVTGYMRHEVVGRLCREDLLSYCDDEGEPLHGPSLPLVDALYKGRPRQAHVYLRHKAGHRVPVRLHANPIRDRAGAIVGAAESFDEASFVLPLDRHQSQLAACGCLDPGTRLPNHAFTQSHLRENLCCFHEYHLPFGVLCLEIEQLQQVRQTRGGEAVEAMLHVIAQTIRHALPDAFLGRWGYEQFLVVISDCTRVDLERAIHDIRNIVARSAIHWWGDSLSAEVAVGWTMAESGDTIESLLGRAQAQLKARPKLRAAASGQES
ncbi:MAG TPA: diguanylate cyclase [Terriglobales bacterium]|nr:diguanylate cyclase [Terriglobales bacterium]